MNKLFGDLKTDEEKSAFFLSGRGYETGVIAAAIQNDVAMAYHRCAEYKKELAALQAELEQWKNGSTIRDEQNEELHQYVSELKTEIEKLRKDAAGLVEALGRIADLPIDPCSTENDYRLSAAKAIAAGVLAAHLKQGGEV